MDTSKQLIRWAVPGTMLLLFLVIFILASKVIHKEPIELRLGEGSPLSLTIESVVTLGAISIPVGFLIYQIYYFVYWHLPFPSLLWFKIIRAGDRGKEILSGIDDETLQRIFGRGLTLSKEHPYDWGFGISGVKKENDNVFTRAEYWLFLLIRQGGLKVFGIPLLKKQYERLQTLKEIPIIKFKNPSRMREYQHNWTLAQAAWYHALANSDYKSSSTLLQQRIQFLSDIYHTLGACTVSTWLAFGFYISIYELWLADPRCQGVSLSSNFSVGHEQFLIEPLCRTQAILGCFFLAVIVHVIFLYGRSDSYNDLKHLHHDIITHALRYSPTVKSLQVPDKVT